MALDLSHLNSQQRKAVKYKDSPLLVIAGAGSGKTRVLTYRVARLIERGYRPSKLMVTTFTKDSANEMRERLEPIIGETKADRLKIGTFHSLSYRILRDLYESNGNYEPPKLIMGGGRWMTMLKIINNYKYKVDKFENEKNRFVTKDIKHLLNAISYWKNEGTRVVDIEKMIKKDDKLKIYDSDPEKNPRWGFTDLGTRLQAYKDYNRELKEQGRIDFDDMLLKTYYLLNKKKNSKFLERQRRKIHHILVDEAQDLNKIQFLLVRTLAGDNQRITMVGDDYQVLYGFRGAKVTEIMDFGKDYNMEMVKLEQNYRSSKNIVSCGNKLIKHNKTQFWKELYTDNEEGMKPEIIQSNDCEFEAARIMDKIQDMILNGYELNDIAILYRTNAQSRAIVDQFLIHHIPHKVYSKEGFYDRKEVKDMLAYLKILNSPYEADVEDYKRIINRPSRFLGKKFIDAIEDLMFEKDYDNFWQALQHYYELDLGQRQLQNAKTFVDLLERCSKKIETTDMNTREIFEYILEETKYLKWLNKELESEDEEPDNDTRMNLDSLLIGSERFNDPQAFIIFVESMEIEKNEEEDAIHCLTIHKSKGMEWPVVFMIGVCEPAMPHYRADDLEEERRIAYVGLTRAKEELYVSTILEKFNRMNARPSRFIEEMGLTLPKSKLFKDEVERHVKKEKKRNFTKYDVNGKVIESREINPGTFPGEILERIDETIGIKHGCVNPETGETLEPENPMEES